MFALFIIIGILGILGAGFIISKKIHSLSLIDIEKVTPKAKKVKEAIIASRFRRILEAKGQKPKEFFKHLSEKIGHGFEKTIDRLMQLEAKSAQTFNKKIETPNVKVEKIKTMSAELMEEAQKLEKEDDWKLAEGKYIEIIKIDSKNINAYFGLGRLYAKHKRFSEARQIFEFLLKLNATTPELFLDIANLSWEENNLDEAKIYYLKTLDLDGTQVIARINLGLVFIELGDKDSAAQQFGAALALEPKNPRYLDLLVESCIKIGQSELAKQALKELKGVNPENQKINDFKKRINEM